MNLHRAYINILQASRYPFKSPYRLLSAFAVSIMAYLLLVLGSYPEYSYQMFQSQASMLTAVEALTWNIHATAGTTGVLLTGVYAVAMGISTTNAYAIISNTGVKQISSLGGAIPGFLVGSCAGCGAGFLGLMGFAGAVALLPFSGNLVKAGAIALLLYFLADTGDPATCEV